MFVAACGGGGGGDSPAALPPVPGLTTYTVSGTVSNMLGTGMVLTNNGDNRTVNTNGAFTFATALPSGFPYQVQVQTPPSSPAQVCTVANGSGTLSGNITNVQVNCSNTI